MCMCLNLGPKASSLSDHLSTLFLKYVVLSHPPQGDLWDNSILWYREIFKCPFSIGYLSSLFPQNLD